MNQAFLDLQMPEPTSWWPLAWGWWVCIILSLVVIGLLVTHIVKYFKRTRARRAAIAELKSMSVQTSQLELLAVLKKAALSYTERQKIASTSGAQMAQFWLANINQKQSQYLADWLSELYKSAYAKPRTINEDDINKSISLLKAALPLKYKEVTHV
ncbi:DUF4381 domain-containing protein [Catenovulum sediminis]|uniref:DUF4381 domain-containing protein n=1 Tax=Catenovulum sediminis TaxID=1740262 RepID=A0ABV1RP06_9ALTE